MTGTMGVKGWLLTWRESVAGLPPFFIFESVSVNGLLRITGDLIEYARRSSKL